MPRPPRDFKPGERYLVLQRGNNGTVVFRDEDDLNLMRGLIHKYSEKYCVRVASYELKKNYLFLRLVPASPDGIPKFMQSVIGVYARVFNKKNAREGHLWVNRYVTAC
jgi:REP element-mobilizing transposase RayT